LVRFARLREDEGFTIVELLVGMVVVALIMGAIASALIVGLRTTDATTERLNESHDVQISSAYLANDVQSAASVQVAGGGDCSSQTTIVTFTYADGRQAVYACGPGGGETRVTRTFDRETVVLAHFAGPAKPSVTCAPSCGSGTPARVDITFTERSGYSFTLTGSRRTHGSEGVDTEPRETTFLAFGSSPLEIKGGCKRNDSAEDWINCIDEDRGSVANDRAKLTVIGNLYVNAGINGAVKLTGKANLLATGEFKILSPGTCSGCTPSRTSPYPPGSYAVPLPDPFANLTPPTSSTIGGCSGGVCRPGRYPSRLSITSSTTLLPGIYILEAGISVTSQAVLNGNGVMLYIKGGDLDFAGGSQIVLNPISSASDPYRGILIFQPTTNTNALKLSGGTVVGEGNSDNCNKTAALNGVVYARGSRVTLGSGGACMTVKAVIAENVIVTGNSRITIG
jgi:prepilin-type N-terminal cleavage/methylation domain-containing protein